MGTVSPVALVGRDAERARIAALLDGARAHRSGGLVLVGPAGCGKSALLDAAADAAEGMRVLRARGIETEAEFAFSGLHDVLRPVLALRMDLPGPQRAALEGALALGPPAGHDRFAVSAATLGVLAAAAEREPVLVVLDDLQWIDTASAEALLFAARRLADEGVAVVAAMRAAGEGRPDVRGLDQVRLGGLAAADALALLRATRPEIDDGVAGTICDAAGGNPLALLEAPRMLSPEQLTGLEPLHGPLPVGDTIARAYAEGVEALPAAARRALVVAAVAGALPLDVVARALVRAGTSLAHLDEPEGRGMVRVGAEGISFPHPLRRSAAYQAASPSERRAAHRAIAGTLDAGRAEQRAWHLAAAAFGPDAEVADALAATAGEVRRRGAHWASATALRRAAALTPDPGLRAERLLRAARDAQLAGRTEAALAMLDEVEDRAEDLLVRTRAVHLRGVVDGWRAPEAEVHERLVRAADEVEGLDARLAADMLADAAIPSLRAGRVDAALATARRAAEHPAVAGAAAPTMGEWAYAMALIVNGRAREAAQTLERCAAHVEGAPGPLDVAALAQSVGRALMWTEQYARARGMMQGLVDAARGSAPGVLPMALGTLAEVHFRTGRLVEALACAGEGAALAADVDQGHARGYCLAGLARVEAVLGRDDDCRAHAAAARDVGARVGANGPVAELGGAALGLLAAGRGDAEAVLRHLEPLAAACAEGGLREPAMVQYGPLLVEALIRVGRRDDAARRLAALEAEAAGTGRVWALAGAARCRGLLASDTEFDAHFAEALRLHGLMPTPFERARTLLCRGERLRRARRRGDARESLHEAERDFARMGALPWAERARGERGVSGETARRGPGADRDALTAQEVQVALMVAGGATNREAGARLFLSAKTIEAHLGRIYRKLGVRSRTELAALVSRGALAEGAALPAG
ncbi:MAG TPA: LuxR family transcriptional regulator [Miltoncostaeaceae bacterium]|nr:LuxR family transcriptional regulator [Miltoncostaeaceae bacterium]